MSEKDLEKKKKQPPDRKKEKVKLDETKKDTKKEQSKKEKKKSNFRKKIWNKDKNFSENIKNLLGIIKRGLSGKQSNSGMSQIDKITGKKKKDVGSIILKSMLYFVTFFITLVICSVFARTNELGEAVSLAEGLDILEKALSSPALAFKQIFPIVPKAWEISIFIFFLVGIISFSEEKRRQMREHDDPSRMASAQWGDVEKFVETFGDDDHDQCMILSNELYMSLNGKKTMKNNNVLIIGGSGTGKTRFNVKPNLLQCNASYYVVDPDGSTLESVGKCLEKHGYKIKVFNLVEMNHSFKYNPFVYLRDEASVKSLVSVLIENTNKGKSGGDPFWEDTCGALYSALILYLVHYCPPEEQNFMHVNDLIRAAANPEEDKVETSALDIIFENIRAINPDDTAIKFYDTVKLAPAKTLKSVLISAATRLQDFDIPAIQNLTNTDTLDLTSLGDEKTALFAIISQTDTAYNYLVAMMNSQLFDTLYHHATECKAFLTDGQILKTFKSRDEAVACRNALSDNLEHGGTDLNKKYMPATEDYCIENPISGEVLLKHMTDEQAEKFLKHPDEFNIKKGGFGLPVHLRFILDEFYNIGKIPQFENKIATVRRYNISTTVILQSLAQIKDMYKETFETVVGCCDTIIFLGSSEMGTAEYVSKLLGETTLRLQSRSLSQSSNSGKYGSNSGVSIGNQKAALLDPSELTKLDKSLEIVRVSGQEPFISPKYIYEKHPRYPETADADDANFFDIRNISNMPLKSINASSNVYDRGISEKMALKVVDKDMMKNGLPVMSIEKWMSKVTWSLLHEDQIRTTRKNLERNGRGHSGPNDTGASVEKKSEIKKEPKEAPQNSSFNGTNFSLIQKGNPKTAALPLRTRASNQEDE